jgi:peptidoglycan/LPS O-acetylase OafA/YrhL
MTDPRAADPAHTVPLVVPPTSPMAGSATTTMPTVGPGSTASGLRFADLPDAPAAYHQEPAHPKARGKGRRRPLHPQESAVLAVVATVVVLIVAKALVDTNDVDTNVVDVLLYAVLATLVGIAVVGIGGGLVRPMQSRWQRLLDPSDGPRPTDHEVYPSERPSAPRGI